jgi:hypothetical protein
MWPIEMVTSGRGLGSPSGPFVAGRCGRRDPVGSNAPDAAGMWSGAGAANAGSKSGNVTSRTGCPRASAAAIAEGGAESGRGTVGAIDAFTRWPGRGTCAEGVQSCVSRPSSWNSSALHVRGILGETEASALSATSGSTALVARGAARGNAGVTRLDPRD